MAVLTLQKRAKLKAEKAARDKMADRPNVSLEKGFVQQLKDSKRDVHDLVNEVIKVYAEEMTRFDPELKAVTEARLLRELSADMLLRQEPARNKLNSILAAGRTSADDLVDEPVEDGTTTKGSLLGKPNANFQRLFCAAYAKDFSPQQHKHYQNAISQFGNCFRTFPPGEVCRLQPEKWEEYWEDDGENQEEW